MCWVWENGIGISTSYFAFKFFVFSTINKCKISLAEIQSIEISDLFWYFKIARMLGISRIAVEKKGSKMQLDWLKYMYDNKQAYIGAALILNMQVSYGI